MLPFRMNPVGGPHPPASLDAEVLVNLESLEGAPLGDTSIGGLHNILKHHAKRGYGIVVKTSHGSNIWRLADLAMAQQEMAFDLVRRKPVVIAFDTTIHRDLPSVDSFRVRLAGITTNPRTNPSWEEYERQNKIDFHQSMIESLEATVASNRRKLAIPRGGADLRAYKATNAKFQAELDEDLRKIAEHKAALAVLLSS